MANLRIETYQSQKDVTTLSLDGFIDAYTYTLLKETFQRFIDKKTYKFIVDLSRVNYMASAAMSIFINFFHIIDKNNGLIIFVNPRSNVKETFELLGLNHFFTIAPDQKTALKIFN
ncbi:MAG: STAS domain-containing protein [Planctomycetes bacterium]|nr:STAS domain-containing protein [Planctomycetota bacterium]